MSIRPKKNYKINTLYIIIVKKVFVEDDTMINELNLEMSTKLNEMILKIIKVNPWKYFKSLDFIKIMIPNAKEPIYCNMVGHHKGRSK